jgi:hypothetical protein
MGAATSPRNCCISDVVIPLGTRRGTGKFRPNSRPHRRLPTRVPSGRALGLGSKAPAVVDDALRLLRRLLAQRGFTGRRVRVVRARVGAAMVLASPDATSGGRVPSGGG